MICYNSRSFLYRARIATKHRCFVSSRYYSASIVFFQSWMLGVTQNWRILHYASLQNWMFVSSKFKLESTTSHELSFENCYILHCVPTLHHLYHPKLNCINCLPKLDVFSSKIGYTMLVSKIGRFSSSKIEMSIVFQTWMFVSSKLGSYF